MIDTAHAAQEGNEFRFRDKRGQDIVVSWHPSVLPAPTGKNHGAAGICFTPEQNVVLVTWPGVSWEFPAGRPERGEDWRATLDREILEEACASVEKATLLGFARSVCINGSEEGLVLVRSLWCAEISLNPWEPRHETTGRIIVRSDEVPEKVGFSGSRWPIYQRWFRDALATKGMV